MASAVAVLSPGHSPAVHVPSQVQDSLYTHKIRTLLQVRPHLPVPSPARLSCPSPSLAPVLPTSSRPLIKDVFGPSVMSTVQDAGGRGRVAGRARIFFSFFLHSVRSRSLESSV